MITYDKFMKIVPKETGAFVNCILEYLNIYIIEKYDLDSPWLTEFYDNEFLKEMAIFCYGLTELTKYSSLMGKFNFKKDNIVFDCASADKPQENREIFNNLSKLFLIYDKESDYYTLTPLDLVVNLKYEHLYDYSVSDNRFRHLIDSYSKDTFFDMLSDIAIKEKNELKKKLEIDTFGILPIATIEYLKTASKIRNVFESGDAYLGNDIEKFNSEIDYVPASLLLAIYFYKNNETEMISKIISKYIDIANISNIDISNQKYDINIIVKEYIKYFKEGICVDKDESDITITDVFLNLFDRNITKSYVVQSVLNEGNNECEKIYEEICNKRLCNFSELNKFYKDLPDETREFIELSNKIYQLVKIKMNNNSYNKKILINDNDALILSIYIANCYCNGNINNFFLEFGNVNLDNILNLININITQEELNDIFINIKQIMEMNDIIYGNKNSKLSSNKISIDQICLNICDSDISKSLILRDCFNKLSSLNINKNFSLEMNKFFEAKELQRKKRLSKELFCDMQLDTITFLEDVSRVHKYLLLKDKTWYQMDLQVISLILASLGQKDYIADFLCSKSLNIYNIFKYFDIKCDARICHADITKLPIDIDILVNFYQDFIFNGLNKNIAISALTVYNIVKNALLSEINDSVVINKLLMKYEINNSDENSFDNDYYNYIKNCEYKKIVDEGEKYLCNALPSLSGFLSDDNNINYNLIFIKNTLRIHKRIVGCLIDLNLPIMNDKDLEKISLIISLHLASGKRKHFCEKNGLSLDNILKYCNLKKLDLTNLDEEIDYELLLNNYKKYVNKKFSEEMLVKEVILDCDNNILENIVISNDGKYNILKEEIKTGKEHVLTLSERIEKLNMESVGSFVFDDVTSILNFGNCLSSHSQFIYDEIPKLMMSDANSKSVETINEIINRSYVKEEVKKKTLFEKLFLVDSSDKESKLSLDPVAIKELKDAINDNIVILSKELLVFDKIRKYIEVYQKKNYDHLVVARESVVRLESENENYNQEIDDDFAKFLSNDTNLKIMKEKVNRFITSNQLMKQELVKINQTIVNHFVTINALEMARDDLLPLIGSELAINLGRDSENAAIELSNNVMELFQSLLTRNVECAKENIEKINSLGINNETLSLINNDIFSYIGELEKINSFDNLERESLKVKKLVQE